MQPSTQSDLLLVVVTLLAAMGWVFSKESIALMPPLLFMGLRFLLAALCLAGIGSTQLRQLTGQQIARSARVGVVFGVAMLFWVQGLAHSASMGEGAFLTSLGVLFVPVVARLCFAEPIPSSTWLALPVALLGMALLSLANGFTVSLGQLFYLCAAMCFALFFTLNSRAATVTARADSGQGEMSELSAVPPLALTVMSLTTVGVVTLSASLLTETGQRAAVQWSAALWGWLVASALIGTALRFWLQTYAQSLTVQTSGAVMLILEPIWVAVFAALWFSETLSLMQLLGCGVIFLALLVNRWRAIIALVRRRGTLKVNRCIEP